MKTNPNPGALPELIIPERWNVDLGTCALVSIPERRLRLVDDSSAILAHELAHIVCSPEKNELDNYGSALEDCRVNQWLRARNIVDMGKVEEARCMRVVLALMGQARWKEAILCLLSIGRHTYPTTLRDVLGKSAEKVAKLADLCFTILEPEDGVPAPFSRVPQLAAMLREAFEPPITLEELEQELTGGKTPEKGTELGSSFADACKASAPIDIVSPPKTLDCRNRTSRARDTGTIPTRMDRYAIDGAVFSHRTRNYCKGTVLIDASGSMHLDNAALHAIVKRLPFGRVAYYSASTAGHLVIAGEKGRAIRECVFRHGGNNCDPLAFRWLASQPGPRTVITDRGWCVFGEYDADLDPIMEQYASDNGIRIVDSIDSFLDEK